MFTACLETHGLSLGEMERRPDHTLCGHATACVVEVAEDKGTLQVLAET